MKGKQEKRKYGSSMFSDFISRFKNLGVHRKAKAKRIRKDSTVKLHMLLAMIIYSVMK